jgi:hypothetical protein
MPNFCPHCGTAVTENSATNCLSCGKPLSVSSETAKNDSFNDSKEKLFNFAKNVKDLSIKASADLRSEETKAKMKDFANQAQSFATEKTKDLKDELNKINEARKETASESSSLKADSKLETAQAIGASFWSKLTGKQKGILIGTSLLIIVLIGGIFDGGKSGGSELNSMAASEKGKAAEYPYIGLLSCSISDQKTNVQACLSNSGVETEVELRNGNEYRMYKIYDINQIGNWDGSDMQIDLRKNFEIKAQNANKNLILNLVVKDRSSGKILFQKSAAMFGVITVKN